MSSSRNALEDIIRSGDDYNSLKTRALEAAASSTIHVIPLNRQAGTFLPFIVCRCVQDLPYNPCVCPGPILWIKRDDIFGIERTSRRCLDGQQVFSLRVKAGASIVEERHAPITFEELQRGLESGASGSRFGPLSGPDGGLPEASAGHVQMVPDMVRRCAADAMKTAARQAGLHVDIEALALACEPGLLFVNAPIAGLEKLDFRAMLDGHPVLDDTPVMYWSLSGEKLTDGKGPIPAGFYTVVATERSGRIGLKNPKGNMVAEGELGIGVGSSTGVARIGITGGIDTLHFGKHNFKFCGHVKIDLGVAEVSIDGCVEVSD